MAKKRKGRYPNLDPSQNTKRRTDYIEADYVDGVVNNNGKEVIRPLNEEEKAWLNKFYGEYVAMSDRELNPTDEIMSYMAKKSEYKKKIAGIRKKTKLKTNKEIEHLKLKIEEVENALDFLRAEAGVFHPTCEEQRDLYNTNNSRNYCTYNNLKARGMLIDLTTETYDSFIGNFWDILASFDYDSQDALIDIVEERLRENGFLGEETPTENLTNASSNSNNEGDDS